MIRSTVLDQQSNLPLPQWEFVAMVAALISLNALAIDTMLPALGIIAEHFSLQKDNDQQLVLFAYILGFGAPQLVFGPVSDRFGRKGLLRLCLLGYVLTGFASMLAPTFIALLALRFVQGVMASGIRVIAISIVRDLMKGRNMARIMSLVMTVFMIVPIFAPAIGQWVMTLTSWYWTFGVLGLGGLLIWLWVEIRLPETLSEENR
ncbi:MAG: MFS transporter, partial [Hyphomonadaceae bacterium]|nr:MFS transporter [Hyphomonadaceae bacterium]